MPFEKGHNIGNRFKKGEVGNPNGRPKGKNFSTLLKERINGEEIIRIKGNIAKIGDDTSKKKTAKVGDEVEIEYQVTTKEKLVEGLLALAANNKMPTVQLNAIKEIADRTEGKAEQKVKQEVTGDIQVNVEGNISLQVTNHISTLTKAIPVNLLIVAMVCAKRGINPTYIMAQLATSYYSNFNGFGKASAKKTENPFDITTIQYDWNEINSIYKQNPNEGIEDAIVIEEPTPAQIEAKDKLLKMLNL